MFDAEDKDVTFKLKDGSEKAHSVVLAAASDVFKHTTCGRRVVTLSSWTQSVSRCASAFDFCTLAMRARKTGRSGRTASRRKLLSRAALLHHHLWRFSFRRFPSLGSTCA